MVLLSGFLAVGAAAQGVKVDKDVILKKVEKSDADFNDEKKNTKTNYWLDRGKVYMEAGSAASTGLYSNMDLKTLQMMFGKHLQEVTQVIGGKQYIALTYPNFVAYTDGNYLLFWKPTLVVKEGALDTAFDAYAKAYDMNPKLAPRVKTGILELANEYKKDANNYYSLNEFKNAAEAFGKAYEMQLHPAVNEIDTLAAYNAGTFYTLVGDYDNGLKFLNEASKYSYDNDGNLHYLLYHNYYGRQDFEKAREILQEGLRLYPGNTSIVESLVSLYTTTDDDPKEIIPIVEQSIAKEPDNPTLWNGLGGIYYKLGDMQKSVEAFEKACELDPNDYMNYLRVGSVYIDMGNDLVAKVNETNFTSNSDYQKALDDAYDVYMKAVAPLEKAHELEPTNRDALDMLKSLTFRLRDREGMQAKLDKYTELWNNLPEE